MLGPLVSHSLAMAAFMHHTDQGHDALKQYAALKGLTLSGLAASSGLTHWQPADAHKHRRNRIVSREYLLAARLVGFYRGLQCSNIAVWLVHIEAAL